MSLTGIKDTDFYILYGLDDKTLFNICLTNLIICVKMKLFGGIE
jgi:hypothetical protein